MKVDDKIRVKIRTLLSAARALAHTRSTDTSIFGWKSTGYQCGRSDAIADIMDILENGVV